MDKTAAIAHLRNDPRLHSALDAVEIPEFTGQGEVYFSLLESIVSQQLSVKAADTIFNRFLTLFPDGKPHADLLLKLETEQLRGVGLSYQKAGYLKNVAQFSLENDLEGRDWSVMSDAEIIVFLTKIKGVGQWTVEMLLMFTLGRPDVLPVDDLGIQQGMAKVCGLMETGRDLKKRMAEEAEIWRPWRTVACRYLWRWKDLG